MIEPKAVGERAQSQRQSCARIVLERCAEWLAADLELDQHSRRWAELEAQLQRDHGWLRLSHEQRQALPAASELFGLEASLEALSQSRDDTLRAIGDLRATDLAEATAKLAVVARLLRDDDGPTLRLVSDVVCALHKAKKSAAQPTP